MICTRCTIDKPDSDFYFRRDRGSYERQCKPCRKVGVMAARGVRNESELQEARKLSARKQRNKKFGITDEQYLELEARFNGRCWICLELPIGTGPNGRRLHLDHDHETGELRGLLCTRCNTLLGMARDSVHTLRRAVAYLNLSERPLTQRFANISQREHFIGGTP